MPPPIQTGYLDSYGHPAIRIAVYGVAEAAQQQFEAIIDTGFTGFLMMPLSSAYSLTLTLMGTANYELADGSICSKLLAHGSVTLEDEVVSGVITLEERNDCVLLLGMDFLSESAACALGSRERDVASSRRFCRSVESHIDGDP